MTFYDISKRIIDIIVCLPALLVLSPLFIVITLIIRFSSSGPAIFSQQRVGRKGEGFTFYKFRTMRLDTDPYGASPKAKSDPRLTAVGRFIREYSLDELPQLLNVLKGDMSLVGPRPLYIAQMKEWNDRQKTRLLVKPGLTGLAQINGRGHLTVEQKLELDAKYVETVSFFEDIRIMFVTLGQVFCRSNIYEDRYSAKEYTRGQQSPENQEKTIN